MADKGDKPAKLFKKTVEFNGSKVILWSLDGNTWSSNQQELATLEDRHLNMKTSFSLGIKGSAEKNKYKAAENKAKAERPVFKKKHEDEVIEPVKEVKKVIKPVAKDKKPNTSVKPAKKARARPATESKPAKKTTPAKSKAPIKKKK